MMFWHLSISDTYPMEIRDLRALLPVVRCGSFTAAAKELGYTQSATSQQVAALELELSQLGHEPAEVRVAVCPLLPADHPLQNRERIDLDVLADAPWIVAPALAGGADERAPTGPRPELQVVYDGKDLPTLLALVAAGLGAALLPAPSCARVDGVTAIPLCSPRLVHRTELLALRTTTPRQQRVIEVLRAKASLR
jgi:DNA-binding transcriptional LysR family regulator